MSNVTGFDIMPCTDKDWCKANPHQIDVEGYDGNGWIQVSAPMTDDDLDALITMLREYRRQHPRAAQNSLAPKPKKPETT